MNIGDILKIAGRRALKEVPLGGVVIDVAELVLRDKLDRENITGEEVEQLLSVLELKDRKDILTKQIDSPVAKFESVEQMKREVKATDTPLSKERARMLAVIVYFMLAISFTLTGIIMHQYVTADVYPSVEMALVSLGFPLIALLTMFGMDTKPITDIVLRMLSKRIFK